MKAVTVIGGGLAGCEIAIRLARDGIPVTLVEQKPEARTPAQQTDYLGELVCSNSLRAAQVASAVGLLKEEMRRVGSLVIASADATRVPAGGALAVDRLHFAQRMTEAIANEPRITLVSRRVDSIPSATSDHPVVIATGPLTADDLALDLERVVGARHLAYYDAIAPVVSADSIDMARVFRQSRWGRSSDDQSTRDAEAVGDEAYINCPMDEAEYRAFIAAMLAADKVVPHAFEKPKYFEGCLPVEVMAERGEMTLAFGPMKPVGLTDPRTGKRPFAVVQLRQEDEAATAFNLVGFQTKMTQPYQARVFRTIPGLENAEFMRFGSVHRNTFVNAPEVLDEDMQLRAQPHVYLAGQITGVEGYVESAASGIVCALLLLAKHYGLPRNPPPKTTALGGLLTHLSRGAGGFQPSNVTWAWVPPHENRRLPKKDRYAALAERALRDLANWQGTGEGDFSPGVPDGRH